MQNIDILMVTEADYSPVSQFEIESFINLFRLDRNRNGKDNTLYTQSYIIA